MLSAFCLWLSVFGCGENDEIAQSETTIRGTTSPQISGVEVRLFQNGELIATALTDPRGTFIFKDLTADTYEIDVIADGYLPIQRVPITIARGQTLRQNFILVPTRTRLNGLIVNEIGMWVTNAIVKVASVDGEISQNADEFGQFNFESIWDGIEITLTVSADGYKTETIQIDPIPLGKTVTVTIEMKTENE